MVVLVLFPFLESGHCYVLPSNAVVSRQLVPPQRGHAVFARKKKSQNDDIFDEYFAEKIAKDIQENIDLPFMIPSPMIGYLVEQTIRNISTDLSRSTKVKLQEFVEAAATPSKNDDLLEEEINQLADQIAKDINPKIDVPVLDEDQEYLLLQQIMRVILQSMAMQKSDFKMMVNTNLQMSRELLGSPESRLQLAKAIDKKIEISLPMIDEAQRLALISKALDSSADMLSKLLPPELLESLKGESPEGLLKMKEYLIDTVNAKVDLVGLNEEEERQLIDTMINVLVDEYVDDTEAEILFLNQEEQEIRLREKRLGLEREKEFSQRRFEREQANIDHKLERIKQRLKEIRRSKSLLRRILRR